VAWEVEGIRQRGRPKNTWLDYVKDDMESLGLSQKDAQLGINGEEELRGQPANPGSPGKWPLKRSVCTIGGGSYWAGRAVARPLFGLRGPQLCLARPLLAT